MVSHSPGLAVGLSLRCPRRQAHSCELRYELYSQQSGTSHASIGASVRCPRLVGRPAKRHRRLPLTRRKPTAKRHPALHRRQSDAAEHFTEARQSTSSGPGSFWYHDGQGERCIYVAGQRRCLLQRRAGRWACRSRARTGQSCALAVAAANRLPLDAGHIQAEPVHANGGTDGHSELVLALARASLDANGIRGRARRARHSDCDSECGALDIR